MEEKKLRAQNAINYLIYKGVAGTQKEIGDKLGYGESYFSQIISGGKSLSDSVLRKIAGLDEGKDLNLNWLLTGEGEMLVKQRPTNEATVLPPEDQHWIEVPLVPYEAMAGELGWYRDVFPDELCQKRMVLVAPGTSAHDHVVFTVAGDSMEPRLEKGDEVLAKLVPVDYYKNARLHIDRYNIWVVVTRTEGILIKKIVRHDVANHTITLHSLNPLYSDFDVDLADVAMIYHAVSLSRKNL